MRTRKWAVVGLAVLTAMVTSASVAWTHPGGIGRVVERGRRYVTRTEPLFDTDSPVGPLNWHVQMRFRDLEDTTFGLSRLVDVKRHGLWFFPERSGEKQAVDGLREGGWDVLFYLGGRSLLAKEKEKAGTGPSTSDQTLGLRQGLSEPVFVTRGKARDELPERSEVRERGRQALRTPWSDPSRGAIGRWGFETRLVYADQQACLDCHTPRAGETPLRLGDPLGVMIYLYARASD